jgi:hypothetical protein
MMCLCFHVAEIAQGQDGHLCQDLLTCQVLPGLKFTPCIPVDQLPLHLFHHSTDHQESFQKLFPTIPDNHEAFAFGKVAVWVLHESVVHGVPLN